MTTPTTRTPMTNTRIEYQQAYRELRRFFRVLDDGGSLSSHYANEIYADAARAIYPTVFNNAVTSLLTRRNGKHTPVVLPKSAETTIAEQYPPF